MLIPYHYAVYRVIVWLFCSITNKEAMGLAESGVQIFQHTLSAEASEKGETHISVVDIGETLSLIKSVTI